MEAILNKFVRTKAFENSEVMSEIRQRIQEEVEARYSGEIEQLRYENTYLYQEQKVFQEKAYEVVKHAFVTKVRVLVKTQVGKNGSVINEYIGHIENLYDASKCFNMVDEQVYEGNPFTIGMSCLLSIKILN